MEYLLKASAVIVIFYLCYKLFLQRDTFFESNRWFLLMGLITAFALPYVVIPIYVEYTPMPVQNFVITDAPALAETTKEPLNIWHFAFVVYTIGVVLFSVRFLMQLGSLALLIVKNKKHKQNGFTFIETQNETPPFSFFRWIVFNPNQFKETELQHIIAHEKVHVKQYHSIDILISQIAAIIFWFNPITWFYKKDLQQNLEFIADYKAQKQSGCKKSYQHLLLRTSVPNQHMAITNNFYNSLIKKRIVMLHKSKSKKINLLKYTLVLPFLALFLTGFNTEKVYVEKEKPVSENAVISNPFIENALIADDAILNNKISKGKPAVKASSKNTVALKTHLPEKTLKAINDKEVVIITKNFSDADFKKVQNDLKKKGITAKFKGIKRNDNGEITAIKIDVRSKASNANYNISSDEAIKPIKISFDKDDNSISIGNGTTKHMHGGNAYVIKSNGGKHKIHKTGKGHNVFVFSSDDEDYEIIHEDGDSIHFNKNDVKKGKYVIVESHSNVEVISDEDHDENVEVIVESDGSNEAEDVIILKRGKPLGKSYKIKTIGKSNGNGKIHISTDSDKEPLYILDGKKTKKK